MNNEEESEAIIRAVNNRTLEMMDLQALTQQINAQNATIILQLQGITARLTASEAQLLGINTRLAASEARANANVIRLVNSRVPLDGVGEWAGIPFRPIVKYIPGHPGAPPAIPAQFNIQLLNEYPVDSLPPVNLLPENSDAVNDWRSMRVAQLRPRILAIHWFYNDPRFQPPAVVTLQWCRNMLVVLLDFLWTAS